MSASPAQKRVSLRSERRDSRLSRVASTVSSPNASGSVKSALSMEQSPLTLQARPDVFEPKIVDSYRRIFRVSNTYSGSSETLQANRSRRLKTMKSPRVSGKNCFS